MPLRPQMAAGSLIEPPPSEPVANGTMPLANAAAEPPDEPPGVRSRFQGLRVSPVSPHSVAPLCPYSGVVVFPITTQPAARSRATSTESPLAGSVDERREPNRVGRPATSSRSFTASGIPASGPTPSPATKRRSISAAVSRACSASTTTKALSSGSTCSIRAKAASVSSRADRVRLRTSAARSLTR